MVLEPSRLRCFLRKRGGAVSLALDRKAETDPQGEAGGHAPPLGGTFSAPSGRPFTKRSTTRSGVQGYPTCTCGPRLLRPLLLLAHLNALEAVIFARSSDAFIHSLSRRLELIAVWFRARRYGGARWTCRTHGPACNRAVLFVECSQPHLLSLTFVILYSLPRRSGEVRYTPTGR